MAITMILPTLSNVFAQTTDGSIRKWCENKKDELKDRLIDLILLGFKDRATYGMLVDINGTGTILIAEIDEKMKTVLTI